MRLRCRTTGVHFLVIVLTLLLGGCPGGSGIGLDETGRPLEEGSGSPPPPLAATFESVQASILTPRCTVCHAGAAAPVGLKLDATNSFDSLVNVSSVQVPDVLRVAPGDPDNSYLLQKLEGTAAVGAQMPLGGPFLDADALARVRAWIAGGALPPAPPAPDVPPVVLGSSPGDDAILDAPPAQISVAFSKPMDASLLGDATVQLDASGDDASFSEGNETRVVVNAILLQANDPTTLVVDLGDLMLPDEVYQLRLVGTGPTALADLDGLVLDGDSDGNAGGDRLVVFTINSSTPAPQATFASIQDQIFTPLCVVCHVADGQAAFLPLDETNSYDALVGVPSTEVPSLLRVQPLNPDDSYLVQKLEGTAAVGAQMPLGGAPLAPEFIDAVRDWITAGAVRRPGDPVPDVVPPLVVVTAPIGPLAGSVTVVANASDASGVASVSFLIDGAVFETDVVEPYEATLDTTLFADGSYTLEAEATDAAGNLGRSAPFPIAVSNAPPADIEPPSVSLAAPGATVSGTVTLAAAAVDNVGVALVRFFADDVLLGVDTQSPFALAWDSTEFANGPLTLRAQAQDAAGNTADSQPRLVTVDNAPPPDIEAPVVSLQVPASAVSGTISLAIDASDNVGVTSVRLLIDDVVTETLTVSPFIATLDTTLLADGVYSVRAEADDAAGNTGQSAISDLTIDNAGPGDVLPPVVTLADPGDPLTGEVTFMATASDDVGVVSVAFLVDGVVAGTDITAPYTLTFDTTTLSDGSHSLQARALDAAGNAGVSAVLSVNVDNADRDRPTLDLSVPAGPVSGLIDITVMASDNVAVASVTVFVDGTAVGSDSAPPYEFSWDSTGVANGLHVVAAQATDTSGNVGAAAPFLVEVSSADPQPTLPWIQANVFEISCAAGCHTGGGIASFLRLDDAENSFDDLVNVAATNGGSSLRVTPFDADDSALVQRLEGTLTPAMPLGGAPLSTQDIAAVRAWIDGGALATPADIIAPAVALMPPDNVLSGVVTLDATAVDDNGVASITFLVDDASIGTATIAPYSLNWDTGAVTNGDYRVRARAADAAGNTSESLEFVVTVNNTTPTGTPAAGEK